MSGVEWLKGEGIITKETSVLTSVSAIVANCRSHANERRLQTGYPLDAIKVSDPTSKEIGRFPF